ncbi:MAG: peptidylprolyl isomerase, partial [Verrucomicrobiota bacterium]
PTRESILNEASNGLRNERGTIAMARTNDKDSASSQFYFNLTDNEILDHGVRNYGYTVFGRIISGIEVIDAIAKVPVSDRDSMQSVPVDPVTVLNVREVSREEIERGPVKRDRRF